MVCTRTTEVATLRLSQHLSGPHGLSGHNEEPNHAGANGCTHFGVAGLIRLQLANDVDALAAGTLFHLCRCQPQVTKHGFFDLKNVRRLFRMRLSGAAFLLVMLGFGFRLPAT